MEKYGEEVKQKMEEFKSSVEYAIQKIAEIKKISDDDKTMEKLGKAKEQLDNIVFMSNDD